VGHALFIGILLFHPQQYRLDRFAVRKLKKVFDSTIRRLFLAQNLQRHNGVTCFKIGAQRLGKVDHIVEVKNILMVDPPKDLLGTESGLYM